MSTEPASPTRNSAAPRPRRRWLRFNLRTLLGTMLALGLVLGIFSEWVRRSERQRQLVAQLESQRTAAIYYDAVYEREADGRLMFGGPGLLDDLGDYCDYFHDVWGLDWDGVTEKEQEMLAATLEVAGFSELRFLNLEDTSVTDRGMAHLAAAKDLRDLDLEGTKVGEQGAPWLANFRHLKDLNLSETLITDIAFDSLSGQELEWLRLDDCRITDSAMPAIARLGHLRDLILDDTDVTEAGVSQLANHPKLTFLSLDGAKVSVGRLPVKGWENLEHLSLNRCQLTEDAIRWIESVESLRHLTFQEAKVSNELLASVCWPVKLKSLDLSGIRLNRAVVESLKRCTQFESLRLWDTHLDAAVVAELEAALPKCTIYAEHSTIDKNPFGP